MSEETWPEHLRLKSSQADEIVGWMQDDYGDPDAGEYVLADIHATAIREAVEAERERCARIAFPDRVPSETRDDPEWPARFAEMYRIARAIRSPDTEPCPDCGRNISRTSDGFMARCGRRVLQPTVEGCSSPDTEQEGET